jgi:hypothetical protein
VTQGETVVAHNASFDVSALIAACAHAGLEIPPFGFLCTLRAARAIYGRTMPLGLEPLAQRFGIPLRHHDPSSDAAACLGVLAELLRAAGCGDVGELQASLGVPLVRVDGGAVRLSANTNAGPWAWAVPDDAFGGDSISGKRVAFTGALIAFPRQVAKGVVEAEGGEFSANLSKKVNLLVVGAGGGAGSKLEKAHELIEAGADLRVVTEREFFRMLGGVTAGAA